MSACYVVGLPCVSEMFRSAEILEFICLVILRVHLGSLCCSASGPTKGIYNSYVMGLPGVCVPSNDEGLPVHIVLVRLQVRFNVLGTQLEEHLRTLWSGWGFSCDILVVRLEVHWGFQFLSG